jgi:hypothetical protein
MFSHHGEGANDMPRLDSDYTISVSNVFVHWHCYVCISAMLLWTELVLLISATGTTKSRKSLSKSWQCGWNLSMEAIIERSALPAVKLRISTGVPYKTGRIHWTRMSGWDATVVHQETFVDFGYVHPPPLFTATPLVLKALLYYCRIRK